jgi:hypothetical protein
MQKKDNNKEEYAPRRAAFLPLAATGGAAMPLVKVDASNKKPSECVDHSYILMSN